MKSAIVFKKVPSVLERFGGHEGEQILDATIDCLKEYVVDGEELYVLVLNSGLITYLKNKWRFRGTGDFLRLSWKD